MSLPREPRQKMINMMYLVLTALLALNVSSEILNAFKTVNNSLQITNATVNNSTQTIMESLNGKLSGPTAAKAQVWKPKADQVQTLSKGVYDYIQTLKDRILTEAGGDPKDPTKKFKEDNLDIATHVMVEKGEGKKLFNLLSEYKTKVLAVDPLINTEFSKTLQIDLTTPPSQNKGNQTWETAYFRMTPTVAALTILSKFQNDIKTSENKVIAYCHEQVGKVEVRFDAFEAIVGQNSKYFMPGQEIEINAGLGAFSKTKLPTISINGSSVATNEKGIGTYKAPVGALGNHTVNVTVKFLDQDNVEQTRTIPVEYTVGQSNASIALDKMNVLYIGVDNPITVAASGGGDDKVAVSISNGGSITKTGAGKYIARVGSVNDNTVVTVNVDGKVAGSSQFRVRTIPSAQAYVGGKVSGTTMSAGAFKAQAGVGAGIMDFPFELQYTVLSYTFTCDTDDDIANEPNQGAAFGPGVRNAINRHVKAGRMVTIDDIKVKGPDGRTTTAPSLVYYIN
ncbi:MAG: gliding motility protein GldM [Chitinophagaceae bacterium]|nr:MAG: gliding motility protein GldM [Chitinophagaceae bacterium]